MSEPGLPIDGNPEPCEVDSEEAENIRDAQESKASFSGKEENPDYPEDINDDEKLSDFDQEELSETDLEAHALIIGNDEENSSVSHSEEIGEESCIPETVKEHQDKSEEQEEDIISNKLKGLSSKLDDLQKEFKRKLKYDAHKEKLIDSLHNELQLYKNDLIKKHVQSLIMDVIKVIDDIRKLSEHYRTCPSEEIEVEKLLGIFDRIPSDLEDIFFYQGVTPYQCKGNDFDPKLQRVLKNIETSNQSKDKTVAERIRPGYEWEGKILRPEIVAVYLYKEPSVEGFKEDTI